MSQKYFEKISKEKQHEYGIVLNDQNSKEIHTNKIGNVDSEATNIHAYVETFHTRFKMKFSFVHRYLLSVCKY